MANTNRLYQTTDTKCAAYLLTESVPLSSLNKANPRRIVFCFPDNPAVQSLLRRYWANLARVNPRLLFDNYEYLKDLIHQKGDI